MARRKIRHFGPFAYNLTPDEILGTPKLKRIEIKPRHGFGSGRAGGARSATHKRDHRRYVDLDTKPENCPICKYGMKVWTLWVNSAGGIGEEEWLAFWEGQDERRREFERFVGTYNLGMG